MACLGKPYIRAIFNNSQVERCWQILVVGSSVFCVGTQLSCMGVVFVEAKSRLEACQRRRILVESMVLEGWFLFHLVELSDSSSRDSYYVLVK